MHGRLFVVGLVAAIASVALVACGGDDEAAPPEPQEEVSVLPVPPAEDTAPPPAEGAARSVTYSDFPTPFTTQLPDGWFSFAPGRRLVLFQRTDQTASVSLSTEPITAVTADGQELVGFQEMLDYTLQQPGVAIVAEPEAVEIAGHQGTAAVVEPADPAAVVELYTIGSDTEPFVLATRTMSAIVDVGGTTVSITIEGAADATNYDEAVEEAMLIFDAMEFQE